MGLFARAAFSGIQAEKAGAAGEDAAGTFAVSETEAKSGHGANEIGILDSLLFQAQKHHYLAATKAGSAVLQQLESDVVHGNTLPRYCDIIPELEAFSLAGHGTCPVGGEKRFPKGLQGTVSENEFRSKLREHGRMVFPYIQGQRMFVEKGFKLFPNTRPVDTTGGAKGGLWPQPGGWGSYIHIAEQQGSSRPQDAIDLQSGGPVDRA